MATTKTSDKGRPQPRRETPEEILNEEPPEIVASIDEGAEVATAGEREAAADDYEANARLDDTPEDGGFGQDFSDEQDTADRPDSAAIFREEGDESSK
jgi:hypothetical protein